MSGNWRHTMPTPEAYWIDRVLFDVQHKPADLARFKEDPDGYLADVPLSPERKREIRNNEFGRMYEAGANPYLIRAHCLAMRVPEAEFLASIRSAGANTRG